MPAQRIGRFMMAEKKPLIEDTWTIRTNRGDLLGIVEFYPDWHQFVFVPRENTIYSAGCLQDLNRFLSSCKKEVSA